MKKRHQKDKSAMHKQHCLVVDKIVITRDKKLTAIEKNKNKGWPSYISHLLTSNSWEEICEFLLIVDLVKCSKVVCYSFSDVTDSKALIDDHKTEVYLPKTISIWIDFWKTYFLNADL